MYVTVVYVHVKPDHVEEFKSATKPNHTHSIKEEGNLRFDILQDAEDPTRFILYEAYESREAAARHKSTPHYLTWRETIAEWMAEPRKGVVYEGIFPQ
ncbi:MAG: antibiotic biosynthesis monooxygenase [Spirochaetes bacterium]|nr:antibiotic biosynthesis monooxygenase [Spirochaetota bacterium]